MLPSSVTNGLAASCATITARRPERFVAAEQGAPLCLLDSAVLVRALRAEIPLFFYAAEIAAAKMLLFLRKSASMGFLTKREGVNTLTPATAHRS